MYVIGCCCCVAGAWGDSVKKHASYIDTMGILTDRATFTGLSRSPFLSADTHPNKKEENRLRNPREPFLRGRYKKILQSTSKAESSGLKLRSKKIIELLHTA